MNAMPLGKLISLLLVVLALGVMPGIGEAEHLARGVAQEGDRLIEASVSLAAGATVTVHECGADGTWLPDQVLLTRNRPMNVGPAVALDGDLAVVALPGEAAYIYERAPDGVWRETAILIPSNFSDRNTIGEWAHVSGGKVSIASQQSVYVYEREDGQWKETDRLTVGDDRLASLYTEETIARLNRFAPSAPAPMMKALADTFFLNATDGVYEDRTGLDWPSRDIVTRLIRMERDGVLLGFAASSDFAYDDTTGVRDQIYTYRIIEIDGTSGAAIDTVEDDGHRTLHPVVNFEASDGTSVDDVALTWDDQSEVESGFIILRDGSPIDTLEPNSFLYHDSAVAQSEPGSFHNYCIRVIDGIGGSTADQCDNGFRSFVIGPSDFHASVGVSEDSICLTWTDNSDNEAYFILVGSHSEGGQLFVDTLAPNTTSYVDYPPISPIDYELWAEDSSGNESERQDRRGSIDMKEPEDVSATDDIFEDLVLITWSDTLTEAEKIVIFRDSGIMDTLTVGIQTYSDSSAVPGTTYFYELQGIHSKGGISSFSSDSRDSGSAAIILAPSIVEATDGTEENEVIISWETESVKTMLFKIFRGNDLIHTASSIERSVSDTTSVTGTVYNYRVSALSLLGDESSQVSDQGHSLLNPPSQLTASNDDFEPHTVLEWRDNSDVETGYNVYRDGALRGTTLPNVTLFEDTQGQHFVDYEYTVTAFDDLSESTADTVVGGRNINEPTNAVASQGDFEDRIQLTWTDNSNVETNYQIWHQGPDTLLASLPANTNLFVDSTLTLNDISFDRVYHILPFQTSYGPTYTGNFQEPWVSASGSTDIRPPGSFNATETYDNKVVVSWVDNSEVEGGYRVYRDGAQIATTGPDSSFILDTAGNLGETYEYSAVSFAISGNIVSDTVRDDGAKVTVVVETTPVLNQDERLYADPNVEALPGSNRRIGNDIAIFGDRMVVGARNQSEAYVFEKNSDGEWAHTSMATPANTPTYGAAVDIDGDRIVGSSPGLTLGGLMGGAIVFERNRTDGTWSSKGSIVGAGLGVDSLGSDVAISGDWYAAGAPASTKVIIVRRDADWVPTVIESLTTPAGPSTRWGAVVEADEDWLFVGSPSNDLDADSSGVVDVYLNDGTSMNFIQRLSLSDAMLGDRFGKHMAANGDRLLVGVPGTSGSGGDRSNSMVVSYAYNGSTWEEEARIIHSGSVGRLFGSRVSLDGNLAAIGASERAGGGAAYVYYFDGKTWELVSELRASNRGNGDDFGTGLAMNNGTIVAGAIFEDDEGNNNGALYLFETVTPPADVSATDGTIDAQVKVTWDDQSNSEEGFNIYRDGELLETVGANIQSFSDFGALPGQSYEYSVASFTNELGESAIDSDFGRRPPDGSITGRVTTLGGAAVESVSVCIEPSPNTGLLFDGEHGRVEFECPQLTLDGLTVEMWWNSTNGVKTPMTPFSYETEDQANPFSLYHTGGDTLRISIAGTNVDVDVGKDLYDGQWHHISVGWQGSNGRVRMWVDGFQELNALSGPTTTLPAGGWFVLGQDQDGPGENYDSSQAFEGIIDDVRIWAGLRSGTEIQTFKDRELTGGEANLIHYWPLNQVSGFYADDLTENEHYGRVAGGAHWAEDGAPIDVCVVTDEEGNYVIPDLRYGNEAEYSVVPEFGLRTFEPAFKRVRLDPESPVANEIEFNDVTSFTVSGQIRFENTDFCKVEGADILVDGSAKGRTDANGNYTISVLPGSKTIEPVLGDHVFNPVSTTLNVTESLTNIDFKDQTTRTVSGFVGGGNEECPHIIGKLIVQTKSSGSSCLTRLDTLESEAGSYELSLPAGKYSSQVVSPYLIDFPQGIDAVAVARFFENVGRRSFDLTDSSQVLDFAYRGPITIEITGLPDPEECLPMPVPVIEQLDRYPLTITVSEYYGESGTCPVDSEYIFIFDDIIDKADSANPVLVVDGEATYETAANTPNITSGLTDELGNDRSHQKFLTVLADFEGQDPVTNTKWAIVTGHRARPGTFVTGTTEPMTAFVLRDPPGDGSYSYLEEGFSLCVTTSDANILDVSGSTELKIDTGIEFESGFGVTFKTKLQLYALFKGEIGVEINDTESFTSCLTVNERYQTSSSPVFVGDSADVFLGFAMNLEFAETDIVTFENCSIVKSTGIAYGPDREEPYETGFAFTELHIRNSLIPQLEFNLESSRDSSRADTTFYMNSIANWDSVLTRNETAKAEAEFDANRSFSAGADYEFSQEVVADTAKSRTTRVYMAASAGLGFDFETGGSGSEGEFFFNLRGEWITEVDTIETTTRTVGYVLSDDDLGDFMSVDVQRGQGDIGGGPIFGNLTGQTSCPFEPGTVARDLPELTIISSNQSGIDPDDAAEFIVVMQNLTESDDLREYELRLDQISNPGGAVVKINGNQFEDGISFFIPPLGTVEATMTVERGPTRFRYDDLQLFLTPPCEWEQFLNNRPLAQSDSATFTVSFEAPCSDITLFTPEDDWSFASADGDSMLIQLADFVKYISGKDAVQISLATIGAEYRLANTDDTFEGIGDPINLADLVLVDTLAGTFQSESFYWQLGGIDDGDYEIRAFTTCQNAIGATYSLSAFGTIDRSRPIPIGTPEPADLVLSVGDEIAITFNEQLECLTVDPANIRLRVLNPGNPADTLVAFQTACDGTTIQIVPTGDLSNLEGRTLQAQISSVEDLAGNPIMDLDSSATILWEFEYRQSSFTWAEAIVQEDVDFGSPAVVAANLDNGSALAAYFELSNVPTWLTPDITSGAIAAGGSQEINFTISDTLAIGTYVDTLTATDTLTALTTDLIVQADVACSPPTWAVNPSEYQYNMSVIADITIPGAILDTLDQIAAYVGGQVRGLAMPVDVDGQNLTFLTVYSNRLNGEFVRFEIYDQDSCDVYPTTDVVLKFQNDDNFGSTTTPIPINAATALPDTSQTIDLDAGWNWFSLRLDGSEGMDLDAVLGNLTPATGDLVKSETSFSQLLQSIDGGGNTTVEWIGSLVAFDNTSMYQITLSEPGSIQYFGAPAPLTTAIPADAGWNWISYLPETSIDVNTALMDLSASAGDILKSQDGFAQYVDVGAAGWYGTLNTMNPGEGYKLHLATTQFGGFEYSINKTSKHLPVALASSTNVTDGDKSSKSEDAQAIDWDVDHRAYQYSMTMTIDLDFEEETMPSHWDKVGAFVGDELRGVSEPQYIPGLDRHVVFLMVHGDTEETVEFRYFGAEDGAIHEVVEKVGFQPDAIHGDVVNPFHLKVLEKTIDENDGPSSAPAVYELDRNVPNPFNPKTTIRFSIPSDGVVKLKIYDVSGREVMTLVDEKKEAGSYDYVLNADKLASGVYFYKLNAGDFEQVRKMTLIR